MTRNHNADQLFVVQFTLARMNTSDMTDAERAHFDALTQHVKAYAKTAYRQHPGQ